MNFYFKLQEIHDEGNKSSTLRTGPAQKFIPQCHLCQDVPSVVKFDVFKLIVWPPAMSCELQKIGQREVRNIRGELGRLGVRVPTT